MFEIVLVSQSYELIKIIAGGYTVESSIDAFLVLSSISFVTTQYLSFIEDVYYLVKRHRLKRQLLALQQLNAPNVINPSLKMDSLSPSGIGFIPTDYQIRVERPYQIPTNPDEAETLRKFGETEGIFKEDLISFKSGSDHGSWLIICMRRQVSNKNALVDIIWHNKPKSDALGETYINNL